MQNKIHNFTWYATVQVWMFSTVVVDTILAGFLIKRTQHKIFHSMIL